MSITGGSAASSRRCAPSLWRVTVRRFEGLVRLPDELQVTGDSLGNTFRLQTRSTAIDLMFPSAPALDDRDDREFIKLEPPLGDGLWKDHNAIVSADGDSWGYCSNFALSPDGKSRPVAWAVRRLALRIRWEGDEAAQSYELGAQLGATFDELYAIAVDWFELWSGAIPRRGSPRSVEPSRGYVRELQAEGPGVLTGWGARLGPVRMWSAARALTKGDVAAGFERASVGERPPPEWELFLRSQRAADRRIAIIEAATAAEVALARALDTRLGEIGLPARQLIAKQANGIVGLLKLLESVDGAEEASLRGRVTDKLAGPRNNAVHRGEPIEATVALEAFATARAVLDRYSPLVRPLPAGGANP